MPWNSGRISWPLATRTVTFGWYFSMAEVGNSLRWPDADCDAPVSLTGAL